MPKEGLENLKYYGILIFCTSPKVNQFDSNLVYILDISPLVNHVNFIKIRQVVKTYQ